MVTTDDLTARAAFNLAVEAELAGAVIQDNADARDLHAVLQEMRAELRKRAGEKGIPSDVVDQAFCEALEEMLGR